MHDGNTLELDAAHQLLSSHDVPVLPVLGGRYYRQGIQSSQEMDWLYFEAKGMERDNNGWKFHMSVRTRAAAEELAQLAARHGVFEFKCANDALLEQHQWPDDPFKGRSVVYYYHPKGRYGAVDWKTLLKEASDIVQKHGEGIAVERDAVVPGHPGVYYRNELDEDGKYIGRVGLTDYMRKRNIPESRSHNLRDVPDVLEEIGLVPPGTLSIPYVPDASRRRQADDASAPGDTEDAPARPTWVNRLFTGAAGVATLWAASAALPKPIRVSSDAQAVHTTTEDVPPSAVTQDTPPERRITPEAKAAYEILVAAEHQKKDLGFYALERAIAPAEEKPLLYYCDNPKHYEQVGKFLSLSRIDEFVDLTDIDSMAVNSMRYADMPQGSLDTKPAHTIDFYDKNHRRIASFTHLPRYNGESHIGWRDELHVDDGKNVAYRTHEEAVFWRAPSRISEREIRITPDNRIEETRNYPIKFQRTHIPANLLRGSESERQR